MHTIRDVIQTFKGRPGVDSALLIGRDGLPIDSLCADGVDPDSLAALVPSHVNSGTHLGAAGGIGPFQSSLTELEDGFVIVTGITADILLALFVRAETNVGPLLFEIRRYRSAIAELL